MPLTNCNYFNNSLLQLKSNYNAKARVYLAFLPFIQSMSHYLLTLIIVDLVVNVVDLLTHIVW